MIYPLPIVTLGHGALQIDSICQTQLRRKNPRIDSIRGFFLVKRLGKQQQQLPIIRLRHRVWEIDSICQMQLARQLGHTLSNRYDVKFYESIIFVKLYQWSAQPSSIETWRQLLRLLHNQVTLAIYIFSSNSTSGYLSANQRRAKSFSKRKTG